MRRTHDLPWLPGRLGAVVAKVVVSDCPKNSGVERPPVHIRIAVRGTSGSIGGLQVSCADGRQLLARSVLT